MADKILENNQVSIVGEIISDFQYSHEVYGEGFYMVEVAVSRLSNFSDYIPLMISARKISISNSFPFDAILMRSISIPDDRSMTFQ